MQARGPLLSLAAFIALALLTVTAWHGGAPLPVSVGSLHRALLTPAVAAPRTAGAGAASLTSRLADLAMCRETSLGELVDALTILEIKLLFIGSANKSANVRQEHAAMSALFGRFLSGVGGAGSDAPASAPVQDIAAVDDGGFEGRVEFLRSQLYQVNRALWFIEDGLRIKEKQKRFDQEFEQWARLAYFSNDARAAHKRSLTLLGAKAAAEAAAAAAAASGNPPAGSGSQFGGFVEEKSHGAYAFTRRDPPPEGRRTLVFLGHWALGDFILYSGAIRFLWNTGRYDGIRIVAFPKHHATVAALYRDLPPGAVVPFFPGADGGRHFEAQMAAFEAQPANFSVLYSGMLVKDEAEAAAFLRTSRDPDKSRSWELYKQLGLDPVVMYSHFQLPRNRTREWAAYRRRVAKGCGVACAGGYIVIHEDPERKLLIDRARIPPEQQRLPVVLLGPSVRVSPPDGAAAGQEPQLLEEADYLMFDDLLTIERAVAFHGFDSAFLALIELMALPPRVSKYLHAYLRPQHGGYNARLRAGWHVVGPAQQVEPMIG